ncbi:hypothetical protein AB3K25_03535 [Leuconostoc sp. MS02]|uniref:Uncharacterized protein n=1 Tax=Leuconostoc aquikimchii TaxID=3236804 RepID=A0ABV3S3I5_9LACO
MKKYNVLIAVFCTIVSFGIPLSIEYWWQWPHSGQGDWLSFWGNTYGAIVGILVSTIIAAINTKNQIAETKKLNDRDQLNARKLDEIKNILTNIHGINLELIYFNAYVDDYVDDQSESSLQENDLLSERYDLDERMDKVNVFRSSCSTSIDLLNIYGVSKTTLRSVESELDDAINAFNTFTEKQDTESQSKLWSFLGQVSDALNIASKNVNKLLDGFILREYSD